MHIFSLDVEKFTYALVGVRVNSHIILYTMYNRVYALRETLQFPSGWKG